MNQQGTSQGHGQGQDDIAVANNVKVQLPRRYQVLMHNDDFTTMEFVISVLMKIFHKSYQEAQGIMTQVHKKGAGICGIYTKEVAEMKVVQVHRFARQNKYPLKCSTIPE
jgi:ATP-dependent Clp protease adaptor protein ClpS